MESELHVETLADKPRARFSVTQFLIGCLAAVLLGMVVARAAVWAEHVRAPVLLFPLLVGFCLGLIFAGLMRLVQFTHRPTLLAGALLAGLVAAIGQHYFIYRDYVDARAAYLAQKQESGSLEALGAAFAGPPPDFFTYMLHQAELGRPVTAEYKLRGAAAWASWVLDGVLLLTAAAVVVYVFSRHDSAGDKST